MLEGMSLLNVVDKDQVPLPSGLNTHVPEKPLPLLEVRVHPYRNTSCPRNSPWGPLFVGLGRRHHRMVHPSHQLHCRAGKQVAVHFSHVSRNSPGVLIPGAISVILGSIRAPLLRKFPALLTVCDWSMKLKGD